MKKEQRKTEHERTLLQDSIYTLRWGSAAQATQPETSAPEFQSERPDPQHHLPDLPFW
jgi:hypothetical protein